MGAATRIARTGVHVKTAGEGRYLKAYLSYLAGWREVPPSLYHYDLSARPERAALIRQWAGDLYDSIAG